MKKKTQDDEPAKTKNLTLRIDARTQAVLNELKEVYLLDQTGIIKLALQEMAERKRREKQ